MLLKICGKNGGTISVITTALVSVSILLFALAVFGASRAAADNECDNLISVQITADGKTISVESEKKTVGELLAGADIVLDENDEVNAGMSEFIGDGMNITVSRVEYRTREKSTFIPCETEYTETPLLKMGDEEIVREGINGSVTITIEDKYVNGEKLTSRVIRTERTEPQTGLISRGTALQTPYSKREGNYRLENGIPTEYAYKLSGKVTSYTAPEGSGTYSGRPLVIGSVGVDPDVIPFGSEVYIVSQDGSKVYGYAIASDTGDITDIIADAYMGTTSEHWDDAMNWCAQYCDVYVLTVGDNSVSWR